MSLENVMRYGWTECTMVGGEYRSIGQVLFQAFLVDAHGISIAVSPVFRPEHGDTLRHLKDAAWRAYQVDVKHRRGMAI